MSAHGLNRKPNKRFTRQLCALALMSLLSSSLWITHPTAAMAQDEQQEGQPGEPSFAKVTKDFSPLPGLFTFYQKASDNRVLLEIKPDQFDKLFLLNITREAGDGMFFDASSQDSSMPIYFHKVGKTVQMLVKNLNYRADKDTAINKALPRATSDALLASSPIYSAAHPERGSVLVDATEFFVNDLANAGYIIQMGLGPFRMDPRNSYLDSVKSFPANNEISAMIFFQGDGMDFPTPTLADSRSFRHQMRYSLSALPESNYKPRLSDDRVGHFTTMFWDYNQMSKVDPYVRYINRWNLEKADPNLPLSPPRQPIVYWLENTIPTEYRAAVKEGVLLWNKAFEKIGFKDAIVVKQMPDNADWDPADVRYNTIRWMVQPGQSYAVGPSRAHPLTGEIYDADVRISADFVRSFVDEFKTWASPMAQDEAPKAIIEKMQKLQQSGQLCQYGVGLAQQAAFARAVINSREGVSPDDMAKFIHDSIVSLVAHEVGHTLGLRHNFKASNLHPLDDLHVQKFTQNKGLTGSVMEYAPINLAPKGKKQGDYFQTTLGTYDYWAIEYAYRQFSADSELSEKAQLENIAERSTEPDLAYGTDEDVYGGPRSVDPLANVWDLGSDPLAFQAQRLSLAQELFSKVETSFEKPGEPYTRLRDVFSQALSQYFMSISGIARYVGGIYTHRNHIGDPNGKLPLQVVPADKQRQALKLIYSQLFADASFQFKPELLSKLAPERQWDFEGYVFMANIDVPMHQFVNRLHTRVLSYLMSVPVLQRVQNNESLFKAGESKFTLEEYFDSLRENIWQELAQGKSISSYRRNLQRSHLDLLKVLYLTDYSSLPADVHTLARQDLIQLRDAIDKNLKANGAKLDKLSRAHLDETRSIMDATLKAYQERE